MMFRKHSLPALEEWFAATIEPLPGHTDQEVLACLQETGAHEVQRLAPDSSRRR
jgi:hypothetical protein